MSRETVRRFEIDILCVAISHRISVFELKECCVVKRIFC